MKKNFDTLAENLQKNGFAVRCFDTAIEAAEYLDGAIDGSSVGFGGSMTLEKMGLYEFLSSHNVVHWHQRIPEGKTSKEVREAANADRCYNCHSLDRICRGLSVLWQAPMTGEFEVILVHEELGY